MKKHVAKFWFTNMKIRKKLMFISVAVLVPTLFFLFVLYVYWGEFIRQEAINNFNINNRQLAQTIEDNISKRQMIVRTLCESSQMRKMVDSRDLEESTALYEAGVKPVLEALTETAWHGQMIWVIRYNNDGYEEIHGDYEGILTGIKTNSDDIENGLRDYAVFNFSRISRQYWFRKLKDNLEEYEVQRVDMDYLNRCFSMVAEIREEGESVGMVRLISPLSDLVGEEPAEFPAEGSVSFVLDEDYYLLSAKRWKKQFMADNRSMFDEAIKQMEQGERYQEINSQWVISADALGDTGFHLVTLASAESVSAKTGELQWILIFCFLVIFLLVCVFIFSISRYLSNRLLHLLRAMQRFQRGEENVNVTVRSSDEIGMLYDGYNQMTRQISNLMQYNIEIATEKEKTELHLLQMQINPHFLYNSLSTIFRLAELGENELVKDMVSALTDFYRLSLNKGRMVYTIKDEMRQIEAYLRIFSIRKGDMFSCDIDFNPADSDCVMPKLILQPLVENIFQHAFDEAHTFVHIVISQYSEKDTLMFTVEDDGCGMDYELLKELQEEDQQTTTNGFGLHNVEARLRLMYGEEYGFFVKSEVGVGTKITIRLPKREKGQL